MTEYAEDLREFLLKLNKLASEASDRVHVIWRTPPAYSFRRDTFKELEYRSNERLRAAAAMVMEVMAKENESDWKITVHDTFRVTYPLFETSCDSHHYLCSKGSHSVAGIADAELLVEHMCSRVETTESRSTL
jgi:hypothetical protein